MDCKMKLFGGDIFISDKILAKIDNEKRKVLLITNKKILSLFKDKIAHMFTFPKKVNYLVLADSENTKNMKTLEKIYKKMGKLFFDRTDLVVAFGGGVISDVSGFAAATYLRGVPFINIPTTLLAQVDAAVGGKVAVNFRRRKNLIGTVYFPEEVHIAVEFLNTLSDRDYYNGFIELIKYGYIWDAAFLDEIFDNIDKIKKRDTETLYNCIKKAIEIKVEIVKSDKNDLGMRNILNFGHTFGHALEAITKFKKYKHGEAVAIGILKAFDISLKMGYNIRDERVRFETLIKEFNIDYKVAPKLEEKAWEFVRYDKKIKNGKIRFILPVEKGRVFIKEFNDIDEIKQILF